MSGKKISFDIIFQTYQQNVYPAMLEYLAEDLGVSTNSLTAIGVGYEFTGPSWVFPERDDKGEIIGLVRRFDTGKKCTVTDSKRGLTYAINTDYGKENSRYTPGRHNWVRCSAALSCPICGRKKWCMVSSEDIDNPPAVLCGTEEGSVGPCGESTFLHILRPEGNKTKHCETVLSNTELPILIVEGQTDVAAALDLGFEAIGRPSAQGGLKLLSKMPLHNHAVIVIGENDSGIGKTGMEAAYRTLRKLTTNIIEILPPDGIKDLRTWVHSGLTKELLLDKVNAAPMAPACEVFEDDVAHTIAKVWMEKELLEDGFPNIRLYKGQWLHYSDGHYQKEASELLRGRLYKFLDGKQYQREDINGEVTIVPYKPSRAKISDIFDALNQWCPITKDPPVWLDGEDHPDPVNLIPFQNGVLNFTDYMNGKIVLTPPTPALFSMNVIPYEFDESAESAEWISFLNDIFNKDQSRINLLAEWMGYNCVPDMSYEKMMIYTGRPRSGKSTVLEAMRHMLGYGQCCESSFHSLCGPFGLQPLEGTLAALIGDAKTPKERESDSALEKLLQIVGGDPVTINRKGITQIPIVQLKCRFTMAMNELPAFADHANALEPRLNLLHFENSYVGREDRMLKYRLNKEADRGKLINFALRGLKRLRENQKFTLPKSSFQLQNQFRVISNPIYEFGAECCEFATTIVERVSVDYRTVKTELYEVWRMWCKANGRSAGIKPLFYSRFLASYPDLVADRKRVEVGSRHGDNQRYVVQGLRITNEAKLTYLGE